MLDSAKGSAKGKAEAVQAEFGTLRVLVDAVDDKVNFFIRPFVKSKCTKKQKYFL